MCKSFINVLLIMVIISCVDNYNELDLKKGTFEISINDSVTTYIERDKKYQLEYLNKSTKKELFKIKWETDKKYFLEVINKKDSLDFLPLIVIIDSIDENTYYQTSYIEGIDLRYKSKITKINDSVSTQFYDIIKTLKK